MTVDQSTNEFIFTSALEKIDGTPILGYTAEIKGNNVTCVMSETDQEVCTILQENLSALDVLVPGEDLTIRMFTVNSYG